AGQNLAVLVGAALVGDGAAGLAGALAGALALAAAAVGQGLTQAGLRDGLDMFHPNIPPIWNFISNFHYTACRAAFQDFCGEKGTLRSEGKKDGLPRPAHRAIMKHPGRKRRRRSPAMTLMEQLSAYIPYNEQEARDRVLLLDCLRREPEVLTRQNPLGRCTASARRVKPAGRRVVVAYHNACHAWAWLGGQADGESDLLAVALREGRAESGIRSGRPGSESIYS